MPDHVRHSANISDHCQMILLEHVLKLIPVQSHQVRFNILFEFHRINLCVHSLHMTI